MTDSDLLTIIETDYRSRHMYWIEKRLNRRLEKWFSKTDEIDLGRHSKSALAEHLILEIAHRYHEQHST